MDIFEKNPEDLRLEFRRALIKKLKGAPKIKFPLKERIQLERKFFGEKSNKTISEDDYKSSLLELDRAKYRARTEKERVNIEKKVRFLKKLGGIKKLKGSSKKMPQAEIKEKKEEKKDDSVFQGMQHADAARRRGWLRRHIGDVWKITKGRVTSAKIPEYDKKLHNPKKWGNLIEQQKQEPKRIRKEMQKSYGRAKTGKEKWEIKRDIAVVDKMYGLGKK